jgi:hypothetical protein
VLLLDRLDLRRVGNPHVAARVIDSGSNVVEVAVDGIARNAGGVVVIDLIVPGHAAEGVRPHAPLAEAFEQGGHHVGHSSVQARAVVQQEPDEGAEAAAGLVAVRELPAALFPIDEQERDDLGMPGILLPLGDLQRVAGADDSLGIL